MYLYMALAPSVTHSIAVSSLDHTHSCPSSLTLSRRALLLLLGLTSPVVTAPKSWSFVVAMLTSPLDGSLLVPKQEHVGIVDVELQRPPRWPMIKGDWTTEQALGARCHGWWCAHGAVGSSWESRVLPTHGEAQPLCDWWESPSSAETHGKWGGSRNLLEESACRRQRQFAPIPKRDQRI
jgi:hypothetical protein